MSIAEKFIVELGIKREIKSLLLKEKLEIKDYIKIKECVQELQYLK